MRAGVGLRGREYPLLEYGLTGKASRDVRIFMREGSKMVTPGTFGLEGPAGATAELFVAIGWERLRGRPGSGESISSGKSSSSLKDPEGRGDPDIHYYTCLRFILPFRPPHSCGPCKVSNEPGTGGGKWSLPHQQSADELYALIFQSAECVQQFGQYRDVGWP